MIGHLEWVQDNEIEPFIADRTVVSIDCRCLGLSDRGVPDLSADARALDVEAVVDKLGLAKFCMFAGRSSCFPAFAYMARWPDRVTRAYLGGPFAKGRSYWEEPRWRALRALAEVDWYAYPEAYAWLGFGSVTSADTVHYRAARLRASVTREDYLRLIAAEIATDLSDLLPSITTPILAHVFLEQVDTLSPETVQEVVRAVANGRLISTPATPAVGAAFFNEEARPDSGHAELPSGTCVIMFTDIVESTALTERLGDKAFREKSRRLDESLRALIQQNDGLPVEGALLGDGVLAVFTSARSALKCALASDGVAASTGLQLHVGLHAGDVIRDGNNVFGGAVNIASRISALSQPGQVLVSDTVKALARTSAEVAFVDAGTRSLKGISDLVHLYELKSESRGA
jgi:class 3 adenylate cyclase